MAQYLSQGWLDELNQAAGGQMGEGPVLTIQQVVSDSPAGEIRYTVRVGTAGVHATLGDAPDADVTISQSYATAAALARGELSTHAAFLAGRVRLAGAVTALLEHAGDLAGLDAALAPVRARTTY